jgi:hypothetical protein
MAKKNFSPHAIKVKERKMMGLSTTTPSVGIVRLGMEDETHPQ